MGKWIALLIPLISPVFSQSPWAPSFGFTPNPEPAGVIGSYAVVGDFNGDGKPDIATISGFTAVIVVLGDGSGKFSQPIYTSHLRGPSTLTVADVNGDGRMDLVSYNRANVFVKSSDVISILLGNGDGTFTESASYPTSPHNNFSTEVNPLVVADFDGDGRIDLATLNTVTNTVDVMLGNGDGTFRPPSSYAIGSDFGVYVAAGDFNADGTPDLIIASASITQEGASTLNLLVGLGDGTFAPPLTSSLAGIGELVAGDFNGDGNLDLAIRTGGVSIYLGRGDGSFAAPVFYPPDRIASGAAPLSVGIAIADVTADGIADLVITNSGSIRGYVEVFPGNGDGTFQAPAVYSVATPNSSFLPLLSSLALADLNGDGRIDVLIGREEGYLAVLNGTPGPFLRSLITHEGDFTYQQPDAFFTVQVSNATGALATSGAVTVSNASTSPPTVVTSMNGVGWECAGNVIICSRSDPLEPGSSYPPIRAAVMVFSLSSLPIAMTVSGGGSPATEARDTALVRPLPVAHTPQLATDR
jgi:hypothetical protein